MDAALDRLAADLDVREPSAVGNDETGLPFGIDNIDTLHSQCVECGRRLRRQCLGLRNRQRETGFYKQAPHAECEKCEQSLGQTRRRAKGSYHGGHLSLEEHSVYDPTPT